MTTVEYGRSMSSDGGGEDPGKGKEMDDSMLQPGF
jgi:hypothetical protein